MIKLSQILKAVNGKIKANFEGITIDSKDLEEDFNRPSFRTELTGLRTSSFGSTYKERNFTIRIYFFPSVKGKGRLERLKVTDGIEDAFLHPLQIEAGRLGETGFYIPIEEISFTESDGVLIASFDSITAERIYNDLDLPMMEELEVSYERH